MSDINKPQPGFLFQYTCDLGNGSSLSVSGNWPKEVQPADMNAQVDTIKAVFTRLRAQHELPLIQERIDGTQEMLDQKESELEMFLAADSKKHEKARNPDMIRRLNEEIARLKLSIVKGKITLAETAEKAQ